MADKRISQLIERTNIANNDVLPIVASGATTTNKVTVSTLQDWMQDNLDVGVTSVGITIGSTGTDVNVTGSPITSSGNITINFPTASAANRGLLSSADWTTFNNKVSSVGLSMPSAFSVANSPITGSGTIAVTGAGTVSQYIRGDGSLADFPSGGGGGGSSVNYYLNGSVSQGTIGGIAYQEMNKTPVLGAGTDFVAIADGYLASFITDAGDPALLEIPAGNWNFETYFSASSGGGTPTFYIELYKVNSGGTATLIASNSATPELIAFGTVINPYFSTLAVPTTALAITDRLALRYYVARSGRTITLHTENSHLCQIITTFTTGLTALNGLTAQVQNFATGTSGTDFAISSSVSTHTFNLPDASTSARGVVTTGAQNFSGNKSFQNTLFANAGVRLDQNGTALPTFVQNISGTGLSTTGANGVGFNNTNNFFFAGSDKGCAVFEVNNTGTRNYTLQNASGTLAFTSQIPANPVGGTGAAGRVAYWNGSGTITSDSLFQWNDTFRRLGIGCTPTVSLDVVGAGVFTGSVSATGISTNAALSITLPANANATILTSTGSNTGFGWKLQQEEVSTGDWRIFRRESGVDYQVLNLARATGAATFSSSIFAGGSVLSSPSSADTIIGAYGAQDCSLILQDANQLWELYVNDDFYINRGSTNVLTALRSNGNVGIGTASPSTLLNLKSSTTSELRIESVGGTYRSLIAFRTDGQKYDLGVNLNDTTDAFSINYAGNERFRITSTGQNIIDSDLTSANVVVWRNSSASNPFGLNLTYSGSSPNGTSNNFLYCADSTVPRFVARSNGGLANYSGNDVNLSDERVKKEIEPLESYWDKFKAIEIVKFKYIDQTHDDFNIGVIAQQVEGIAPEFVDIDGWDTNPKLDEEGNEIVSKEEPLKAIYTADLYHATIKVLQEAMAKIEELQIQIDSLKNQIK